MPWQVVNQVVLHAGNTIINPNGLFTYSGAPAAGNLIFSDAPAAGTDQFGNAYQSGAAAYVTILGQTYAIRLGLGDFAGSSEPALFIHNQTSPPSSDPSFSGTGAPANCTAIMYSGRSTAGSTGAGVQATDSTGSGVAGGEVDVIGGLCVVQGNLTVQGNETVSGTLTSSGNFTCSQNAFIGNGSTLANLNLSPKMAIPPNSPLSGSSTIAQIAAFCNSLVTSLENHGMMT